MTKSDVMPGVKFYRKDMPKVHYTFRLLGIRGIWVYRKNGKFVGQVGQVTDEGFSIANMVMEEVSTAFIPFDKLEIHKRD
jgi:hypothetical protein